MFVQWIFLGAMENFIWRKGKCFWCNGTCLCAMEKLFFPCNGKFFFVAMEMFFVGAMKTYLVQWKTCFGAMEKRGENPQNADVHAATV